MGLGNEQRGPRGADGPAIDTRGPQGLNGGSLAAQALPPPIPEYPGTVEKTLYAWKEGKAQILFCRLGTPRPDATWTIKKIRTHTRNSGQLGYTDIQSDGETVVIQKAEAAGYFSARARLQTTAIHLPKELDVTEAQIQAAEKSKDNALVKKLRAFKACRDLILAHELKHVDEAWDALDDSSLGWKVKLSGPEEATEKLLFAAIVEGTNTAPTKIRESADTLDGNTLGPLRTEMRTQHVFIDDGDDQTFRYIEGNS